MTVRVCGTDRSFGILAAFPFSSETKRMGIVLRCVSSGSITNNGDGTFTVTPYLDVVGGNEGTLSLSILLDHANGWPPTVLGKVAAGTVAIPAITRAPAPQATSQPWS